MGRRACDRFALCGIGSAACDFTNTCAPSARSSWLWLPPSPASAPWLSASLVECIFDSTRTGRKRRQLMVCFQQAVKAAGISNFHYHDLRHTFATRLRAANVHEYDIADLLGHSTTPGDTRNTKTTRGYAHRVPKRLRDAVNSLEEGKLAILEGTPTSRQVASGA
jgi:integrase